MELLFLHIFYNFYINNISSRLCVNHFYAVHLEMWTYVCFPICLNIVYDFCDASGPAFKTD